MAFSKEQVSRIYDRASGYCHICHKKVAFKNYGVVGARGAWEVDHSNPRANGGTDRLNNLYPAHISCNRAKRDQTTRAVRRRNGKTRAPLSVKRRKTARRENALAGGALGALAGAALGPIGLVLGAAVGAGIGYEQNPDK